VKVKITYHFSGCYAGKKGKHNWNYVSGCPAQYNDYCTLFNGSLALNLKKGEKYPKWCPIKLKKAWCPLKDVEKT
jgi:hypothetical protein